jgi:2'-5' RNA ligase
VPADEAERWRVFLAIEVPDAVRAALTGPVGSLESLGDVVRINALERIHLTLHFLGHLPRADVEHLPAALAAVARRHQRFRLAVEGVGGFPDIRRPRVLWAGVAGAELPRLIGVQADLGDALRKTGVAIEDRFHPHLTLARVVRPPKATERTVLRDWASEWARTAFGEIPVDHVRLMRSQLGGGPARYTTLATFDLQ